MIDWKSVQIRKEGEIIPEGISLTETDVSLNFNIRAGDRKVRIRIRKEPLQITHSEYVDWEAESYG